MNARNDRTGRGFVLKTPIIGDLRISRAAAQTLARPAIDGKRGTVMAKFFLASGITLLVLIVGVMMWFGQEHLAKLKAQPRAHEQSQPQAAQTPANRIEETSRSVTDRKQAAVEHCRAVQGINAWLGCMEREGVNTRALLKIEQ
jgi:hypothetical protein